MSAMMFARPGACAVFVNVTGSHVIFIAFYIYVAGDFHVLCDVRILSPRAPFTLPTQRYSSVLFPFSHRPDAG